MSTGTPRPAAPSSPARPPGSAPRPSAACARRAGTSSRPPAAPTAWPPWPPRPVREPFVADVTDDADVARLARTSWPTGGRSTCSSTTPAARSGSTRSSRPTSTHWRQMYELNVLGTLRVTQALLPQLRAGERRATSSS